MTGVERIAKERQRQVEREDWTAEHDDGHTSGELAWAAVCYAAPALVYVQDDDYANQIVFRDPWPSGWEYADKRPYPDNGNQVGPNHELPVKERIRQLEKAGALIAAEIDRLLRTSPVPGKGKP